MVRKAEKRPGSSGEDSEHLRIGYISQNECEGKAKNKRTIECLFEEYLES